MGKLKKEILSMSGNEKGKYEESTGMKVGSNL